MESELVHVHWEFQRLHKGSWYPVINSITSEPVRADSEQEARQLDWSHLNAPVRIIRVESRRIPLDNPAKVE